MPSSTDDIVGTIIRNTTKNLSALMKILRSIRYLAGQSFPLRSYNDSESNFLNLLQAEDGPNFWEWLHKETNRFFSPAI